MKKDYKETIRVRAVSVVFAVLALGVFKPFGLDAWRWEACIHLLMIWVLGFGACFLTEVMLRYIARMPRSSEKGVDYIIRRNLCFQLINTPLVSLIICLYRHFVLSGRMSANQLSWSNFFETLAIIAFISFAIGLYWRYKYRNQYLALELEDTKMLNERLQKMQQEAVSHIRASEAASSHGNPYSPETSDNTTVCLTGTTSETVTLHIHNLLYIEAVSNYVKVCYLYDGQVRSDMLRTTSRQMENELRAYPMIVRCHRAFLVNLQQVEQIVTRSGSMQLIVKHSQDTIPVSRSNVTQIKEALKG